MLLYNQLRSGFMNNKAITNREDDFAKWYTDVVNAARLASYTSVKGCIAILPNGYAIWEKMQEILDKEFKKLYKELYNPVEKLSFDYCYPIVLKYCDKYKKLPTRSANMDEEARKAACAYQYLKVKCKDRSELTELRTRYSKTQRGLKGRRNIERVEDFVSKNGYLPFSKQEDYKAAKSWEALRTYFNKHQVVKDFVTKMIQQFSNKTKQIISERRSEISQRIRNQYKTLNNDQRRDISKMCRGDRQS